MTLLEVFDATKRNEEVDALSVDTEDREQLAELINKLINDTKLKKLCTIMLPEKELVKLLDSSDYNARMSAAYSLMNIRFPALELDKYV